MKPSRTITTTSLALLLVGFAVTACGGAEVGPTDESRSAGLAQSPSASPSDAEAMRPERHGGEPAPGAHRRHGSQRPDRMIERFDTDKNGTLEAAELPEHMQERIAEIDGNGDSVVSKDELAVHMRSKFIAHAKARFERKDANKDGTLDESELGQGWSRLSVADHNGDQKLTPEELRAAFESGKIQPPKMHDKRRRSDTPAAPETEPAPAAPAL